MVDCQLAALDRSEVQSDDWFAVAVPTIPGQVRRTPIIVKNGSVINVAALQPPAHLQNFL